FSISLLMGVLAKTVAVVLGVKAISVVDLVVISLLGGVLSSAVVGALAVVLALASNAYGWYLDSVAVPIITAIGDMVTIPAILAALVEASPRNPRAEGLARRRRVPRQLDLPALRALGLRPRGRDGALRVRRARLRLSRPPQDGRGRPPRGDADDRGPPDPRLLR